MEISFLLHPGSHAAQITGGHALCWGTLRPKVGQIGGAQPIPCNPTQRPVGGPVTLGLQD
jgi:hypothetical protein